MIGRQIKIGIYFLKTCKLVPGFVLNKKVNLKVEFPGIHFD